MAVDTQNGLAEQKQGQSHDRADELKTLVDSLLPLLANFIKSADSGRESHANIDGRANSLVQKPGHETLDASLGIQFPSEGRQVDGIMEFGSKILANSLNPWNPGFMSHLYSGPDPVGIVSELVLAVLNTNVHVYETSPALTVVEKRVTKALAALFGLTSPHSGGVSQQGGSASNLTALVTARNTMFPDIKAGGTLQAGKPLVLFTSAGGHYSLEKAAQICGLGSAAVWTVPVDSQGRMNTTDLAVLVRRARGEGRLPFFVNATSGTTVLGAFDPLSEIARVCKEEGLWLHVDASWGGGVVFSSQLRHKMKGCELADSITFNPHKMLKVPITCSFLLVSDLRRLWSSNTLPASYLFHHDSEEGEQGSDATDQPEVWDLADMTLQCGRRGDSLKMAFGWIYYGTLGYQTRIDNAFATASKLAEMIFDNPDLVLVSARPPPCLSVCFYYAPQRKLEDAERNSSRTKKIARQLRAVDFAIEHAPGEKGRFLRAVVNLETPESSIENLVSEVVRIGHGL